MPARALSLLLVVALFASCHRGGPAPASGPAQRLARALPDAAGPFVAGPLEVADGYVRRRYDRGAVSVEITVASRPQAPDEYELWQEQAPAYPLAALPGLSSEAASAFYTCEGPGTLGACDLHAQMRAGFHLEVLGGGHATRADLDALMARVPLAALLE